MSNEPRVIRTPDQRLRIFVSSTLQELAPEREAVRRAITSLRLNPVLFELGARPHPPRDLYRAYLAQSHVFIGIYWQRYGWVAPGETISGLEDEYRLCGDIPRLIYIKAPAPDREPRLTGLLREIKDGDAVSYKSFSTPKELGEIVANDLALMITERFEQAAMPESSSAAPDRTPPALPLPPTTLVGREAEIAAVRDLILQPGTRLVTLTGPGGVGKTRLGLAAVRDLGAAFADGVYWVPLATATDSALVVNAIARALDVRVRDGQPLEASLRDYLSGRSVLLLLDNFEQVLSAGPLIAELLATAPGLKVLVTSRSPLRLAGEHEYPVPPLPLPAADTAGNTTQLEQNAAVRLFVERARAINPSFALTKGNAESITAIVQRLDGLPLAIEIAAARSRLLEPRAMLERLSSRLGFLAGGARDLPERQQTIRSAIDWSYSLLTPELQRLFAQLSVFVGGFGLAAAEAVAGGDSPETVLDGIAALNEASLMFPQPGQADEPRFGMLGLIREFALERLAESGEDAQIQQRHADYYANFVASTGAHLYSSDSERWLDRQETDFENFRATLDYLLSSPRTMETGWLLLTNLNWLWYRRDYLSEARRWYSLALEQSAAAGRAWLRAAVLIHGGAIAMWQSDLAFAATLLDEGLEIQRELDDPFGLMIGLFVRGVLAVNQGDMATARTLLEEVLPLCIRLGHEWFQAMVQLHLGNVALYGGDLTAARARMDESLTVGKRVGDSWIIGSVFANFGEIARCSGDYGEAERRYLASREQFSEVNSAADVAREDCCLGFVALARGNLDAAQAAFETALGQFRKLGIKRGEIEALAGLAAVLGALGAAEQAVVLFSAAQAAFSAIGADFWPSDRHEVERGLASARTMLDQAQYESALERGRRLTLDEALGQALASKPAASSGTRAS